MADALSRARWRPSPTLLAAGLLVIAGFLLAGISSWFLMLVAAGTFGPGILREIGVLRDRDEFQRRADHRAGYHAFLATGVVAFVLIAFMRADGAGIEHPDRVVTFLLALLWFTWLLSSLLAYWGPRRTASRILIVFGCAWLLFTIASNVGSEWTGWAALLMHPLLALPFFALAWLARRWPRTAGALLLVVTAAVFWLIEVPSIRRAGSLAPLVEGITFVLFIGPLLASGVALLFAPRAEQATTDPF